MTIKWRFTPNLRQSNDSQIQIITPNPQEMHPKRGKKSAGIEKLIPSKDKRISPIKTGTISNPCLDLCVTLNPHNF